MKHRNTGPTKKVQDIVRERADNKCEHCGQLPGQQIHHRLPRRMGGTRRLEANLPSNLVLLSAECHMFLERNGRAEAKRLGFVLPDGANPRLRTVHLWRGETYLDDDGGFDLPQETLETA